MGENQNNGSSSPRILLWSAVILGLAGIVLFIFALAGDKKTPPPTAGAPEIPLVVLSPGDWAKGSPEADTILIEYSDFQCPACGAYYPILKRLFEEFGDRILFIYRHFPLKQHAHAELAARAAEAAGKQGKFWEMHDQIFENQKEWSGLEDAAETFSGFARDIGLDMDRFKTDMESPETLGSIAADYDSGLAANLQGTPTFYLNGAEIDNPRSYKEFQDVLRKTLP
ncbi:MAG TPA: thioredoxin domain-containing protein [Nitrospiria bacterium]|nr:thioredoxin domain-containing protein [Nitrospiria bacterium]